MLWHSLVVLFLLNLYQLPLPTPPTEEFSSNFLPKSLGKITVSSSLSTQIYGASKPCRFARATDKSVVSHPGGQQRKLQPRARLSEVLGRDI